MSKAINKAINIFLVLVLLVDAFFVGYWYGLHSHKVLVVQGSDDFLYSNSFTQLQSNFTEKKDAVKEKAEKRLEPIKEAVEKRAKEKEAARQTENAPQNGTATPKTVAKDAVTATDSNENSDAKNSESGGIAAQNDGADSATEATSSKKAEE